MLRLVADRAANAAVLELQPIAHSRSPVVSLQLPEVRRSLRLCASRPEPLRRILERALHFCSDLPQRERTVALDHVPQQAPEATDLGLALEVPHQ